MDTFEININELSCENTIKFWFDKMKNKIAVFLSSIYGIVCRKFMVKIYTYRSHLYERKLFFRLVSMFSILQSFLKLFLELFNDNLTC